MPHAPHLVLGTLGGKVSEAVFTGLLVVLFLIVLGAALGSDRDPHVGGQNSHTRPGVIPYRGAHAPRTRRP
jgi:hypothetical protein